jgi:hypothetical protein
MANWSSDAENAVAGVATGIAQLLGAVLRSHGVTADGSVLCNYEDETGRTTVIVVTRAALSQWVNGSDSSALITYLSAAGMTDLPYENSLRNILVDEDRVAPCDRLFG